MNRPDLPIALVCPDKFRGSVTATEAASALACGLRTSGRLHPQILPVADGGEGTVDCCLSAGFTEHRASVTGADGSTTLARFATDDGLAVIEAAQACGLNHADVTPAMALTAGSFGVGQLIRSAIDLGCRRIVVGVGGTASTDGGSGLLQALGARLRDSSGAPLSPGGGGLSALADADLSTLDPRLSECEILVATDVDNPLLGARGAAAAFAPQKGADAAAVKRLGEGLAWWADIIARLMNVDLAAHPGAGAGGGIGFALLVAGARRVSGAEALLDLLHFDDLARRADLVITGEGSLDATSLGGKGPVTIARRVRSLRVPVIAVAGRATLDDDQRREAGFDHIYQLSELASSHGDSMRDARVLLQRIGEQIATSFAADPVRRTPSDAEA